MAEAVASDIPTEASPPPRVLPEKVGSTQARTLLKDLKACVSGEINFKESPHIVEYVDKTRVEELVNQITAFYGVSQNVKEKGLKTEMFVLKDDSFTEFEKELMRRTEVERRGEGLTTRRGEEKSIMEAAQCVEGRILLLKSTRAMFVLIREKSKFDRKNIEIHEIIHAMSTDEDGKQSGFSRGNNMWHDINEAATEILTLHFQYPDLDVEDLYEKVYMQEIKCGYEYDVRTMLLMLLRTKYNQKLFTFNELAKYYFHDVQVENNAFAESMAKEISARVSAELHRDTIECLSTDLYGEPKADNPKT